ncbi:capsule biosynthesis protein [Lichenihabitans psoromatis]|uniref:capsule biosynthesis protein n=1 Tax=Lichenihabitans psoromatis TaxID=2528642 RepID=UPI0010367E4C|nr:capsule biosynthesis protein [Lichenihabitans psoromatis]
MKPLRSEEIEVQNVKLIRIVPDQEGGDASLQARQRSPSGFYRNLPFLIIVVLPTLLAALYYFGIASSRYQSEVKFVVRSPGSAASSELASLVSGSSIVRAGDDAYIAKAYMLSRDAMEQLVEKDGLRAVFDKAGWDFLWRYPGPFRSSDTEGLMKHYLKFVSIAYEQSSGILTLGFQAFEPEDARRMAGALLAHTEVFLNGLNVRAQNDAIKSAVAQVDDGKQRAYDALDKVTAFRNRENVVDPTKSSTGIVDSISRLSLETSNSNARLAELATTTPQSPEIPTLRTRVAALQDQIGKQRQLLGGTTASLAPRIAEYQRLLLEQQFAERSFMSGLASLESARLDAERQRVFLERVTAPDLPDFPAYPYRLASVLGTLAISYGVFRVFKSVSKDVWDHAKK